MSKLHEGGTSVILNVAECAKIGVRVTPFHVISHSHSNGVHSFIRGTVVVEWISVRLSRAIVAIVG